MLPTSPPEENAVLITRPRWPGSQSDGLARPLGAGTICSAVLPSTGTVMMSMPPPLDDLVAENAIRSPCGDHTGAIVHPDRSDSRDGAPREASIVQVTPAPVRSSNRSAASFFPSGESAA